MGEMRFKLQAWLTAMFLLIASPSVFGQATELIANEGPTPTNAEDLQGPIAEAFPGEKVLPDGLWGKAAGWQKTRIHSGQT
jgi:hypothetical protein